MKLMPCLTTALADASSEVWAWQPVWAVTVDYRHQHKGVHRLLRLELYGHGSGELVLVVAEALAEISRRNNGPHGNTEDGTPPPPRGGGEGGIGSLSGPNPGSQLPPAPPLSTSGPLSPSAPTAPTSPTTVKSR